MASILISACPHDPSTRYGYYYLKGLAPLLARYGHKVVLLRNALPYNFYMALKKYDPDMVILNGHGGSKGVTGCNNHIILGVPSWDRELGMKIQRGNPEWMQGRIVYLFTCHTGKQLAYSLNAYGARAVAAFRDAYIFLSEDGRKVNHIAYPFFSAALQLPILLAAGSTFGQGCQTVRETFREYLEKAEEKGDELEAKYLYHDLTNFISIGDPGASLLNLTERVKVLSSKQHSY